jgi:mannose-6-phosphate isomerase-like protein (cupin superfamily)
MTTASTKASTRNCAIIGGTASEPIAALGSSFVVREWTMSGPRYLHTHLYDDEAFHVLEGTLTFRFADGEAVAPYGTTIFVPAGVAHTYSAEEGSRYLIILTPKLDQLITRLLAIPAEQYEAKLRGTLAEFDTVIAQ